MVHHLEEDAGVVTRQQVLVTPVEAQNFVRQSAEEAEHRQAFNPKISATGKTKATNQPPTVRTVARQQTSVPGSRSPGRKPAAEGRRLPDAADCRTAGTRPAGAPANAPGVI